jgi:hypothetical protein
MTPQNKDLENVPGKKIVANNFFADQESYEEKPEEYLESKAQSEEDI